MGKPETEVVGAVVENEVAAIRHSAERRNTTPTTTTLHTEGAC